MIARELISELRIARGFFDWELNGTRQQIRGRLKNREIGQLFDPVTAVCYLKTGKIFSDKDWLEASVELGLSWVDSGDLNAAANNVDGPAAMQARLLRHDLLQALMLDTHTGPAISKLNLFRGLFESALKKNSASANF